MSCGKYAYSLNYLIARLQRLSQTEAELQQTRLEARYAVSTLQTQANHIRSELQQIQKETTNLVEVLREAKARERPITTSPSRTLLNPLYKELVGTYIHPALPPTKQR